jgi:NTP pyrophosphatase (non-canonical NTP hydrolase)
MIIWNVIGLAGESGELLESIKHGIFHQHGLDVVHIKEELGDLLWYAAAICTKLNLDLSKVMEQNIDKLKMRYPNGYSSDDSKKRIDKL